MTGLLICAAVVGWFIGAGFLLSVHDRSSNADVRKSARYGLALIAVALWLAYAAGGQP